MADNYDDYSREQLLRLLRERDRRPRFGLVWERDEIDHDLSVNGDFVALDRDAALSCGDGPQRNLIVEGDNFDALRFLRMTHTGRVKCIYIDPPYNTGNRDFIYNDRFIDKDDAWRHSKWLEFMFRRLELARELLSEDGVIFVSIDDNEVFHLGLLMEQVFGAANCIATFIWRKVDSPNDNKVTITPDHEFVLCYALSREAVRFYGKNSLRRDRPTMFFPILDPDGNEVYPIHDNGEEARWAMSRDGVEKHREAGTLIWKQREKLGKTIWEPYAREFAPDDPVRPYPSIWADLSTMRQAKAMLRDIFDTSDLFSTPKPVELIERMLRMISDPNAIVLDFFAGSGTTAQAVLNLNKEDGGKRRFILVSSTEATADAPDKNLCRDVCAERVRRVISGYTNKKGLSIDGLGRRIRLPALPAHPGRHGISQHSSMAQVWTALQLIHDRGAGALSSESCRCKRRTSKRGTGDLSAKTDGFCPVDTLESAIHSAGQAVVYSWQPALLAQRLDRSACGFRADSGIPGQSLRRTRLRRLREDGP
jgi:adenine-specific DNA-methyltransferase